MCPFRGLKTGRCSCRSAPQASTIRHQHPYRLVFTRGIRRHYRHGADGFSESTAEDSGWTGTNTVPRIQGADGCAGSSRGSRRSRQPNRRARSDRAGHSTERARNGASHLLGSECNGSFAEYTCVPSANAHAISSDLSDAELASFRALTLRPNTCLSAVRSPRRRSIDHGSLRRRRIRSRAASRTQGCTGNCGDKPRKREAITALGASRVIARARTC